MSDVRFPDDAARESGFMATVDVHRMPSEDLAALLKVSSMLASTLDLPSLMQTAIAAACEVMNLGAPMEEGVTP